VVEAQCGVNDTEEKTVLLGRGGGCQLQSVVLTKPRGRLVGGKKETHYVHDIRWQASSKDPSKALALMWNESTHINQPLQPFKPCLALSEVDKPYSASVPTTPPYACVSTMISLPSSASVDAVSRMSAMSSARGFVGVSSWLQVGRCGQTASYPEPLADRSRRRSRPGDARHCG
jgi:hypothetical protein